MLKFVAGETHHVILNNKESDGGGDGVESSRLHMPVELLSQSKQKTDDSNLSTLPTSSPSNKIVNKILMSFEIRIQYDGVLIDVWFLGLLTDEWKEMVTL